MSNKFAQHLSAKSKFASHLDKVSSSKNDADQAAVEADEFTPRGEPILNQAAGLKGRAEVKNFSNSEESSLKYLREQNPGYDIEVNDGEIIAKKKGDRHWKKLDPSNWIPTSREEWRDLPADFVDIMYDLPAGAVETAGTIGGGIIGGLGGLVAGGGVGAIPGAIAGSAVGGGAASMATESLRQQLGKWAGVNNEIKGDQVLTSGLIGSASGALMGPGKAAGTILGKLGLENAQKKMIEKVAAKKTAEALAKSTTQETLEKALAKASVDQVEKDLTAGLMQHGFRGFKRHIAPKLAELTSGQDSDVILHYADNTNDIDQMAKDGTTDKFIENELNTVDNALQREQKKRGQVIGDIIDANPNARIDVNPEKATFDSYIKELEEQAKNPNQYGDVSAQIQAAREMRNRLFGTNPVGDGSYLKVDPKKGVQEVKWKAAAVDEPGAYTPITKKSAEVVDYDLPTQGAEFMPVEKVDPVIETIELGTSRVKPDEGPFLIAQNMDGADDGFQYPLIDLPTGKETRVNVKGGIRRMKKIDNTKQDPKKIAQKLSDLEREAAGENILFDFGSPDPLPSITEGPMHIRTPPKYQRAGLIQFTNESTGPGRIRTPGAFESAGLVRKDLPNEIDDELGLKAAQQLQQKLAFEADLASKGMVDNRAKNMSVNDQVLMKLAGGARGSIAKKVDDATENLMGGAKKDYQEYLRLRDVMGKYFKDPETSRRSFQTMDAKSRRFLKEQIGKIDKDQGTSLGKTATRIQAVDAFADPSLMPVSSGGTTSTSRSGVLGAMFGGLGWQLGKPVGLEWPLAGVGSAVGNVAGGPWAVHKVIKTNNAANKAAEALAKKYPYLVPGAGQMNQGLQEFNPWGIYSGPE